MDNLFVGLLLGLGFGIYLLVMGFSWLKQKRLIENIPTSKIRSIAMGLVEISGKVVSPKEPLVSPFLTKPCVYYAYIVEEYRKQGKHSRWVTIRSGNERLPFYLKDETGKVLVDPNTAKIDIPSDFTAESGFGRDPPQEVKQFLKAQNLGFETFFGFNKRMRYTEWFIAPNDTLYILGTAADNPNVTLAKEGVENIIIKKGTNNTLFYISDKGEKQILSSLRWKVIGGLFGGAALTVICLAVMLIYLGVW